jgi:hypothetical protein
VDLKLSPLPAEEARLPMVPMNPKVPFARPANTPPVPYQNFRVLREASERKPVSAALLLLQPLRVLAKALLW